MKPFCIFILLSLTSCQQEKETIAITSKADCIVPAYTEIPVNGFQNEDTITVTAIVQLR